MSIAAYRETIRETEDPRNIERRLFTQVIGELERAADLDPLDQRFKDALARNQELWSLLRTDLLDDDNQLPEALRAQLISISLWVDRHTTAVLANKEQIGPLIDINRTIMKGLSGVAPGQE